MSIHLRLGMSLAEVITAVTSAPAAALSLADKAGSLRVGAPADLTVFRLEDGDFALADCHMKSRQAERRFLPVMAFKDGRRIDSDLTRAQDERNWFMAVAEDRPPAPAAALSRRQRNFLAALARRLDAVEWGEYEASRIDLRKAMELKDAFHQARRGEALPLRDALDAVYDSFLSSPFPMQIGLFLIRLDRRFALERMNEVAGQRSMVEA